MNQPKLEQFTVVGVNHWEAPITVREQFSLLDEQKQKLLEGARREGIESLITVSTCNRTEVIAQDATPQELIRLLNSYTDGTLDQFHRYGFEKRGREALEHVFQVAVGLDSQILGDLQIIKQVKHDYELASEMEAVDGPLHRLMQHVFRAHKRSRSETSLAQGAATTAYAAVQFANRTFDDVTDKNILLIGTGKIGKVTVKNLLSMGAGRLTLINRSRERAEFVADRYDLEVSDFKDMPKAIAEADLVIVATGAGEPVVSMEHMKPAQRERGFKLMIDLSVPRNIDPEIEQLDFVDLANMDWLADVTDQAYRKREKNIPHVKKIIEEELGKFYQWIEEQKVVPTIKALNDKLDNLRREEIEYFRNKISDDELDTVKQVTERLVNKIAAHSIEHLRENHESKKVRETVKDMFKLDETNGRQKE